MIRYKYSEKDDLMSFDYGDVVHSIKTNDVKYEEYHNKKGQLHREDGPAVIDYRKTYRHHYYTDNFSKRFDRGKLPRLEWRRNDKLHREDGPAIIVFKECIDGIRLFEEWYINGKLENITGGPTRIEYNSEDKIVNQQWLDSKRRSHREDGPAYISNREMKSYKHGKLHRKDGPAVEVDGEQIWYLNGKKHRYGGGPAEIDIYNNRIELFWFKYGKEHRSGNKPSSICFEGIDEKYIPEIKNVDDVYRLGGKIKTLSYYVNGKPYRKDYTKPVYIQGNNIGSSDEEIRKAKWLKDGIKHREDGPAVINIPLEQWYFEGKEHCVCGPAVMDHHPSLNQWWIHGKRLNMKKVRPWLRSNKIDLSTKEGQLAFYMMWGF